MKTHFKRLKLKLVEHYLKEIIYGGNDGIVTTFAVVAGFSGASLTSDQVFNLSFGAVLLFGIANLFSDAMAMGLGDFLSMQAEEEVYENEKEIIRQRIKTDNSYAKQTIKSALLKKGLGEEQANKVFVGIKDNEGYVIEWILDDELGIRNPYLVNSLYTSFATFISFMIFGSVPLYPFIFLDDNVKTAFILSSIGTFCSLVILGIFKWRVTKRSFLRSVGEVVLIGGISSSIAFIVGVLFKGI